MRTALSIILKARQRWEKNLAAGYGSYYICDNLYAAGIGGHSAYHPIRKFVKAEIGGHETAQAFLKIEGFHDDMSEEEFDSVMEFRRLIWDKLEKFAAELDEESE